jgi:type I restriction enzyme S subunit
MIMADNNENKVLNVPHLRFPEFSGEWDSFKLVELGKFIGGGTPSSSNLSFWTGSIPWISSSDIKEDNINNISISRYITEDAIEKSATKYCPAPVILIVSRVGVGKVALSHTSLCTSQDFCNIIDIKCHPVFLSYNLLRTMKRKSREVQGTSIKGITSDELQKIRVFIPKNKDEQNKISNLLTLLDERIATQNKIIEDLKKLKSAISKQAFAQKPNGWNRLDTLFSKGKAGGTPTSTNKEYYNGEIPFLSINDITKQGKYVRYTENHLSRSGLENSSAWVVPEYSLIISMYASVGLVTINEVPITTSQAMFAMQLRDKDLLDYLYYYLSYFKYRHIHKYLETGTQSNINADIVRGIMIPTYGHSRNMKIASTLQGIDAKIDNELSVLKLFNRQKNYLLSQMFI